MASLSVLRVSSGANNRDLAFEPFAPSLYTYICTNAIAENPKEKGKTYRLP